MYLPNSVLLLNYGNRNVITHIKVKLNKKVFIYLGVMTMHTDQRLMEAYENARVEYFDENSRYVFLAIAIGLGAFTAIGAEVAIMNGLLTNWFKDIL